MLLFGYLSEKASIDEAYIDLTVPVREVLLQKYPYLAAIPPSYPLGLDTPLPPPPDLRWDDKDWAIVPGESDESDSDTYHENASWADIALWEGGIIMNNLRDTVEKELGYTTSAVSVPLFPSFR